VTSDVAVLIVGGGPVGLTASILLSRFDVPSLLVERHATTSIHPKARAINVRTMEIFRQCGVEDAVRAAGLPPEKARFIIWARSLAGEELERRVPWRSRPEAIELSAVPSAICAQDDLERVLRDHAGSLGVGTLSFGTELTSIDSTGDGVVATLREGDRERRVRARYVIAADGARGHTREALGIPLHGTAALYRSVNVLVHADLTRWVADRPAALYFIEQPDLQATFLTINGANRWGFLINNLAVTASVDDYTPERCAAIVRQAAGVPDLDVEILGVAPWVAAAQVVEHYRRGPVFLAGDAAHHMPPTGGFGLNTGVQDAHNLAWKLAAVFHGWAGPSLLDSYEDERLPYGRAITQQSLANAISMGRGEPAESAPHGPTETRARPEYLNEFGLIFGASYESTAVIPDGTPAATVGNPITDYVPVARPGSRAPHVWLERDRTRLSTLDLFGRNVVLLAGPKGLAWRDSARRVADALGVPLDAFAIGPFRDLEDPETRGTTVYDVGSEGAVIVRPDGHVGWRTRASARDPGGELERILQSMLGRVPVPAA
jgi:2-polyprenyl-6-methoxyphenol hydroxylase-like FAD-dependent oxidoreductase